MLSAKTAVRAQLLSYVAAVGCIILAIPPVIIGAIAKSTGQNKEYCRLREQSSDENCFVLANPPVIIGAIAKTGQMEKEKSPMIFMQAISIFLLTLKTRGTLI